MIKTIEIENLKESFEKLEKGASIFIEVDDNVCKSLQLYNLQIASYNNLFVSYINNTCELADSFKIEEFLKKYCDMNIKQNALMQQTVLKIIGEDNYRFILKNNIVWFFELELNRICLRKVVKNNVA